MKLRQSQIELLKELREAGTIMLWLVVNQRDAYERLVKKGFIEKRKPFGMVEYRIIDTGLAELKRLESK